MQNHDLSFKKDHRLVIDFQFDERIIKHEEAVKQQLTSIPGIGLASMSSCIPGKANHTFPAKIENVEGEMQELQSDAYFIDYDFLKQYGIEIRAGREFSKRYASDEKEAMIINEAAVKNLGYKNPMSLRVSHGFLTFISLNVTDQNVSAIIKKLENKWQEVAIGMPLIYSFSDDSYDQLYRAEERFGKLFICFATLAILVSCLGLVGLSVFSIVHRTKEIGVRKILGASIPGIVNLLTRDFLFLVLIAFVASAPVAWFSMNKWLEDFAYRINLSLWMAAVAGITALLVAYLTISFLAIRAALANPAESLRTE